MNLLVIRHGIAEDRDVWAQTGEPDERRPLTDLGRDRMKRNARGLRRIVEEIQVLATSPLTRAVLTAEIVARRFCSPPAVVLEELSPERTVTDVLPWLQGLGAIDVAAIVGHEPHLSALVSWLLTGKEGSLLELKKGAACMLGFQHERAPEKAKLLWSLTPRELRQLAG